MRRRATIVDGLQAGASAQARHPRIDQPIA
jgi:hypothetical protein